MARPLRPRRTAAVADESPHEFSGRGNRRIGIARALALNPRAIIGDEPVCHSMFPIQAQVINLLMMDLQDEFKLLSLHCATTSPW